MKLFRSSLGTAVDADGLGFARKGFHFAWCAMGRVSRSRTSTAEDLGSWGVMQALRKRNIKQKANIL